MNLKVNEYYLHLGNRFTGVYISTNKLRYTGTHDYNGQVYYDFFDEETGLNHNIDPEEVTIYVHNQRPNKEIIKVLCRYFEDSFIETKNTISVRRWGKKFMFDKQGDLVDVYLRVFRHGKVRFVSSARGEHEGCPLMKWDGYSKGLERV